MTDRDAFLQTVRARLSDGIPHSHVRPLTPDGAPPPITYAGEDRDPVTVFKEAARSAGATVEEVDDAAAFVTALCTDQGVRRAVVSTDPECAGVAEALERLGIAVVRIGDLEGTAVAEIGITGAVYGFALTGTLVVDSARAGGRTASLLPPLHVALLRREAILPDAGAFLRHLDETLPDGLPSNLVFVTGPSRSADIELQLTVGVHGPRDLRIGLLKGAQPSAR
jgi:L-lactate dehydrogenase complex protein LldG